MSKFQPKINIESEALVRSLKHGIELWIDDSTPKFRLDQREGRSGFTRYVNARIEGKIGEEAFCHFLNEYYDIEATVDYRIYGDIEITDNGDIQYIVGDDGEQYTPSVELDVKKSKPHNRWLAIRRSVYDKHPDDAPFVLTKLGIEDDIILDAWSDCDSWDEIADDVMFEARVATFARNNFPIEVELVGSAYKDEFTHEFHQGSRLHDPETGEPVGGPLRRDNVGIPCTELVSTRERWDRIVEDIVTHIPVEFQRLTDDTEQ